MNSVSKIKIVVGFSLLLAVLLCSLSFIYSEVERLARSEEGDVQWTDSLISLLHEKDSNTINMLRALGKANEASTITTSDIEQIIAWQDTGITRQQVQQRIIRHRDTVMAVPRKKGFFRRLKEAFVPSKKDSVIEVKTSLEYAIDTVLSPYSPVDSLQEKLKAVAEQKRAQQTIVRRHNRTLQRMDHLLTARIDSLLKNYEQETLERARAEAEYRMQVRRRSARTIGGIAVGAVLLAAVFLVLIGRDVTRSNRYRRDLEEARRRAEDLLAVREKLMLAITHDFKAPLGSIIGYADLLSRLTVDDRQRFYLDNMKTSSEHLLKLVVDLLDFHRLDLHKVEVHPVAFHPARLLEDIRVSFAPLADAKGLALTCHVSSDLESACFSDPLRLRQIISNLLSNAVKFTDRGSITLTARYVGHELAVSVSDTGKGMPPADRERIFQEFTRLPNAQGKEGFGLGLSIVRMLVQLLEGRIEVESTPGQGSTFTVYLPLLPCETPDTAPAGTSTSPAVPPPSGTLPVRKVAMIDDDRIQLTLTAAMLQQSGIVSACCLQVDELLDALRNDSFDLLLTDVQMPSISGFDLLQLLRSSNIGQARTIPMIAVTARSDMQREEFLRHGFAGCLHKPFTVAELLQELQRGGMPPLRPAASLQPTEEGGPDFSALTAFSGDDREAGRAILKSFVEETRQNAARLMSAAEAQDAAAVSAVAHKMIPVFILLKANGVVNALRQLEAGRGLPFTEEVFQVVKATVQRIGRIVERAQEER